MKTTLEIIGIWLIFNAVIVGAWGYFTCKKRKDMKPCE